MTDDKPSHHGGLKRKDIQHCILCDKGVMHDGSMIFYQLKVQLFIVNAPAVQRTQGLEMVLGGNAMIAQAMGADEDLALAPLPADCVLVCQTCAMGRNGIAAILSGIEQKTERNEHAALALAQEKE